MNARVPAHAKFDPGRWMIDTAAADLKGYIGRRQLATMKELARGEEGPFFITRMVELAALIMAMPTTGQTDGQGEKAIAHLHYFTAGADWYITERDIAADDSEGNVQAFGVANLGIGCGAELGYINIKEFLEHGAELDLHFPPRPLAELPKAMERQS